MHHCWYKCNQNSGTTSYHLGIWRIEHVAMTQEPPSERHPLGSVHVCVNTPHVHQGGLADTTSLQERFFGTGDTSHES